MIESNEVYLTLPEIRYKNPHLKQVIVRADFLRPLEEIDLNLPPKIKNGVKPIFPQPSATETITREVQLFPKVSSPKKVKSTEIKSTEWFFHSNDRLKTLTITRNAFHIKYDSYTSYEILRTDFITVLSLINEIYNLQYKRLGLRYVNSIELNERKPLVWGKYINKNLLDSFSFSDEKNSLNRIFNMMEFNFDFYNLRFQYGMPNPDYPAIIKKKFFTLDFDAYIDGLIEYDEVAKNIDLFHEKIQDMFERSITDRLREAMNA